MYTSLYVNVSYFSITVPPPPVIYTLSLHDALPIYRPLLKDVYWLSITDPDYPFLAAVEHTNYIPASEYGGRHLLYLGNYLPIDRNSTRLNSSHVEISYAVFCLKKKNNFQCINNYII